MLTGDFGGLLRCSRNVVQLLLLIEQAVDTHTFVAVVAFVRFKHRDVNIIIIVVFLLIVIHLTTHSKISGMHIPLHEGPANRFALVIFHNSFA
jgi:hypothetical protein